MSADIAAILRRQGEMESDRATFEGHWQEITERCMPRGSNWFGGSKTQGDKRTEKMFDSTASLALGRFAAAMESISTPRAERWHKLSPQFPLSEDRDTKVWLEEINEQLFRVRYAADSGFATQATELYTSLGAIGTGAMFLDDDPGRGLRYRTFHMSKIFIAEDHQGRIDTVHRMDEMTARQLVQEFGEKKLTDKVLEAYGRSPDTKFRVLHCVQPSAEVQYGKLGREGMPFSSVYVLADEKHIIEEGGYQEFPYMIARYVVATGEVYGRSPAMDALPDIKVLNEIEKTTLRTGQRIADPPLLVGENVSPFQIRPGSLVPGGLDVQGRAMVSPLQTGANFPLTLEMAERRRRSINDHFLVTLFQILAEAPATMTATEVLQRAQEKGALLAPAAGRLQSEFLGPLVTREIGIIARRGALPPPPESWLKAGGAGYEIVYTSELSRAQKAGQGVGIMRTFEAITPIAQVDPTVLDRIDADEALKVLADVNGVPAKVLRSDEAVKALRGQRAQAEQASQALQAAETASNSAKNMAQAASIAGIPGGQLLQGA